MKAYAVLRAGVCAACLAALPLYAASLPNQAKTTPAQMVAHRPATASQTASGKIANVAGDSFTLEVSQGSQKQTVRFITDSNTKVKGKLEAGMTASVEYYTDDNGRNVATTVVVESNG
jgi:hypothetical protein